MKINRAFVALTLVGILLALSVTSAGATSTTLVINEVMYDPSGDEADGEWVELYVSSLPGDLENWTLEDTASHVYTFPSLTPSAGEYIVIHTGSGTDDTTGPVYHLYWGRGSGVWNTSGDELLLQDGAGIGVDYIAYGGATPTINGSLAWTGTNPSSPEGVSISLKDDGVDGDSGDGWEASGDTVTIGPDSEGVNNNPPDQVWVDDDYCDGCGNDGHYWGYDAFAIIQDGVDAVASGGTVNVADGTYNATSSPQVTIGKPLQLIGQSRDGVILDGTALSTTSWAKGIWVHSDDVTIKNLTVRNFGAVNYWGYGIVMREQVNPVNPLHNILVENVKGADCCYPFYARMVEHLTIKNCEVINSLSDGIWVARGSHYAVVQDNTVTNAGDHGIWVGNAWYGTDPSNHATITGNVINGAREGGISFVGSDDATITGNTITNVKGEESPAGWSVGALSLKDGVSNVIASGNYIYGNDGQGTGSGRGVGIDSNSSNITLSSNYIYNNTGGGVKVMGTTTGFAANNNYIYCNTGYGAENTTGVSLDFENNWWGDSDGPGPVGPGDGDTVSANVDYDPWLTVSEVWVDDDWAGSACGDPVDGHLFGYDAFAAIQGGIDAVASSGTVNVAAGTYDSNIETFPIDIDKSLTLRGPQAGVDPRPSQGGRTGDESVINADETSSAVLQISAGDVEINGFTITGGTGDMVEESGSADNLLFHYNILYDDLTSAGDEAIQIKYSDGVVIEYNYAYNILGDAFNLSVSTNGAVRYNEAHDIHSTNAAIYCYETTNIDIIGNLVYNVPHNDGIKLGDSGDGSSGGIVRDNEVHDAAEDGITIYASGVIVENNTIYHCDSENGALYLNGADNTTVIGNEIYENDAIGLLIVNSSTVAVTENDICHNEDTNDTKYPGSAGIWLASDTSNVTINDNNITYNADFGVRNEAVTVIDATNNWWGDVRGPYHPTTNPTSTGNAVSDNVNYDPWTTTPPTCGPCTPPTPYRLLISPDDGTVAADESITFTAELFDAEGHSLGDVTDDTVFSIEEIPPGSENPYTAGKTGTWDENVYTAEKASLWMVTGDYGVFSDTANLTVTAGTLSWFWVHRVPSYGIAGVPSQVYIVAKDRHWNIVRSFNETLAISTDIGAINPTEVDLSDGVNLDAWITLYTAGNRLIKVTYGDITGQVIIPILPGDPVMLTINPQTETVTAGSDVIYTATAEDAYGNVWNASADTAFSIEAGAGGSWAGNVYSSEKAGTWTVTAECGGQTDTAILTVKHAAADLLTLSPDPETVVSGESVAYTAMAKDAYGNTWNVTAYTDFGIEAGAGGSWADDVYTSEYVGTWTVTGEYGGVSGTATLEVTHLAVSITLTPDPATVTAGQSVAYTATAEDVYGDTWDVTAYTDFSIETGAGGSWAGNVYTGENDGTWTVTGEYSGLSGTATLTVEHATMVFIALSPDSATVSAGESVTYTVAAGDGYGNTWDVTGVVTYSIVESGHGGVWADNVYTGANVGVWTVMGEYDTLTDTAILTVEHGTTISITLMPKLATVATSQSVTYTVTAEDVYSNTWDVTAQTTFTIETGAGGSWAENVYTSANIGDWTVTADYLGIISDTALLTVTQIQTTFIVISAETTQVLAGEDLPFTVMAKDIYGNSWDVSNEAEYSIEAAAGGTWVGNTYIAAKAGQWTVTASYNGDSAPFLLTVDPNVSAQFALLADPTTIPADGKSTAVISAQVTDNWGNFVTDDDMLVVFSTTAGTLDAETIYTTDGLATVTLTSDMLEGVAVVTAISGGIQGMTEVGFATESPEGNIIYFPLVFMNYPQ